MLFLSYLPCYQFASNMGEHDILSLKFGQGIKKDQIQR